MGFVSRTNGEQTTKTTSSVPLKNFFVKTITIHLGSHESNLLFIIHLPMIFNPYILSGYCIYGVFVGVFVGVFT
jgi:hypothetical protein